MARLYARGAVVLVLLSVFALHASGCSGGPEPVGLAPCDDASCDEGLYCDEDLERCVCDEFSCGEGFECAADRRSCEEAPHRICSDTTHWVDGQGCRCDPAQCEGEGWACSDDGAECILDLGDGGCIDDPDPWQMDRPAFADVSDAAGLSSLGVEGIRLATADLTGNGAADLVIRSGLSGPDDFSEDGERQSWFLANDGDAVFTDISRESGLFERRYDDDPDLGRPVEVIAFADVDNSGALDAITLHSNLDGSRTEGAEVLFNDGTGTFELGPVSEPLHAAGEVVSRSGLAVVDVDRNGFVDLWVGTDGQDHLLLGDGTGSFTEATEERGLITAHWNDLDVLNAAGGHSNAWSVAACDLDGDGLPELLAASYGRAPNHLWSAERSPDAETHYDNHSLESGYAYDHRMDWTDNESARCYCMHNRSAEDCEGVPEPEYIACNSEADAFRWNHDFDREPFRLGGNSGTTICADLNNNGHLDLLTAEIVHWDVGSSSDPTEILYNTGESPPRFERPGNEATGLVRPRDGAVWDDGDITAAAFDFDNSGRLDILIASTDYPGTRAHLFHQQPDGTFERVPADLGIDLSSAHGIAIADFNNNGALDVAMGHSRARCSHGDHCLDDSHVRLFENQVGQQNNWLQLRLEGGSGTNRSAIGAHVEVITDGHRQLAEVDGGHGHYGMQHGLVQHFGLGAHCEATIRIHWPDEEGTVEEHRLPAGHRFHIRQGERPALVD